MPSHLLRPRKKTSTIRRNPGIRLCGVGALLLAAGCGADIAGSGVSAPPPATLDSTVIAEPAGDDGDDDLITPAGADPAPSLLAFKAKRTFCCNPRTIEFVVQPPAPSAWTVIYVWDFGDGRSATGSAVEHTYAWFGDYTVSLTAHWSNGVGQTALQTLSISSDEGVHTEVITAPPPADEPDNAPVAEAGPNQSVLVGELVVLDGSGSYPMAGQGLTYQWIQTAGPTVQLRAAGTAVVTFCAPEIDGQTDTLVFELTVTQDDLQASDEVLVTVIEEPPIPDANTTPTVSDQSVSVAFGDSAVLTLEGSDADDDDLTFSIITGPEHGTLSIIDNAPPSTAIVVFTPEPGFPGASTFTFQATDGVAESNVATFTVHACEPLTIIPMVELNYSGHDEQVIEGLLIWQEVTDTAIVSTRPGRAAVYTKLRERVPGMRIIPGLKTMELLDRFDSVSGWQAVAQEVAEIGQTSGEKAILLEHEMALEPWVKGTQALDLVELSDALALLPGDLQYLWRPSVYWFIAGDEGHQRLVEVCRVAEAVVPDVRFLDQRYCARDTVNSHRYAAAKDRLDAIASNPTLPKLYFYGTDHDYVWWEDSELHQAISYVREDWGLNADLIIYPGVDRWVEATRSLAGQLAPSCSLGAP